MACGCKKKRRAKFVWTDGETEIVYNTEIEAKARVLRKGGSYTTLAAKEG